MTGWKDGDTENVVDWVSAITQRFKSMEELVRIREQKAKEAMIRGARW